MSTVPIANRKPGEMAMGARNDLKPGHEQLIFPISQTSSYQTPAKTQPMPQVMPAMIGHIKYCNITLLWCWGNGHGIPETAWKQALKSDCAYFTDFWLPDSCKNTSNATSPACHDGLHQALWCGHPMVVGKWS